MIAVLNVIIRCLIIRNNQCFECFWALFEKGFPA